VRTVVRPIWKGDDEQKKLVAAAKKAITRAEEIYRKAENDAWAKIKKARDAGVPDTHLCREIGVPRSTLIRRLGPRQDGAEPRETGTP
jgi:hypothetical protein